MTFLFWNTKRRDVMHHLRALVSDYDADLLILAEAGFSPARMLNALNSGPEVRWAFAATDVPAKTMLFVRGAASFVIPKYELKRLSLRQIRFPTTPPFLLGMVHLASPLFRTEDDRTTEAADLAQAIRSVEKEVGHSRTVVIGDFNMSPFSRGLTTANGFNAVMSRDIAAQQTRIIDGKTYPFFYNPMCALYGNEDAGPPGTFFNNPRGYESVYWHAFDQVLIRPPLVNGLAKNAVRVVTESSEGSLCDHKGRPSVSDHFPLLVSLTL